MVNLLTELTGANIEHNNSPIDNNAWDENRATYYSGSCGRCSWSRTSEHTFTKAYTLKAITIYWYGGCSVYGQYDGSASTHCHLYVKVGGVYIDISSAPYNYTDLVGSASTGNGGSASGILDEIEYAVDIVECTAIKAIWSGIASCSDPCTNEQSNGQVYDLRAFADIGGGYSCII